jgi:hypothetical protein
LNINKKENVKMATIEIKLELDWISEDGNLDEHIKKEVISNLQNRFIATAEDRAEKLMKAKLSEVADKVTNEFLTTVMSGAIENLKIPYKSSDWSSVTEDITLSEFVGRKYERFLKENALDKDGNVPSYSRDAKYSIHEYFTNRFLEKELVGKVSKLIQTARQEAEETVIKTLEQNLKAQLSADLINRLNIPSMLKSLQEKAVELQGESEAPDA